MRVTRAAARAALERKTTDDSTSFRILDLPPELVEEIFDHFTEPDDNALFNVRRVCRVFRDLSFKPFGSKYFRHLVVMLHPLSLTVLLEIASHRRLAPFVHQITVSGERIGGVIDMLGGEDEQEQKDLQTSMLNSEMDRLMLTDVFYKLSGLNLSIVRIDNESFSVDPFPNALRCGSKYIFKGATGTNWRLSQDEINPAVSAVVASISDTGSVPCIEMVIDVREPDCQDFFDPTSATWKSDVGESIVLLHLSGELDSEWALNLLRYADRLCTLEVIFAVGLFKFTHPDTGPLRWPELQQIRLDNVYCNGKELTDFFNAHNSTLLFLDLSEVHLMSGSWKDIFQIWRKKLGLVTLMIDALTETSAPATHLEPLWAQLPRFEDLPNLRISYIDRADILAMLDALLYDFRTTDFQRSSGYLGSPMYRVDFRLACAVHVGRAEIRDGTCRLLEL
ncbi:hypothetical protein DE146DRAFT_330567 [Phaeosphaeria sp. MPI-PUGE-AT-0046c]|nr:hypothetical protein DE146DRAFT_330567 [Phaeosphaeria sp. MPI-PUGE-AT-0046c]